MLKKFILTVLLISPFLISAQMTGNDRDKHGCIGSAGYSYSKIKKDCIQIHAQENILKSVSTEGHWTLTCVIFNENNDKAEIFLPNEAKSIILKKKGENWTKSGYQLTKTDNGYELKKDDVLIYKT